ncbi:MAG: hypothetical protein Athens041674_214 [Parcubacteria group bacterium Athens0416_74]|nr:MAG: hypothetical protein Athens041674_214 [Parcubacteria group bacterium Athens0416_74]
MPFHPLLIVGFVAHISSSATYIWSTYKGRTQPNRVTFFMWAVAAFIATAAALAEGAGWAALPVFMSGFMPFVIFLTSFANPNAYWKLGTFDYACGVLSALALVLWVVTSDPLVAMVFAIAADAAAGVPTVIKAYRYPETEHFGAYAGSTLNNILIFFIVPTYTFATVAFPAYFITICSITLFGVYRKRLIRLLRMQ